MVGIINRSFLLVVNGLSVINPITAYKAKYMIRRTA